MKSPLLFLTMLFVGCSPSSKPDSSKATNHFQDLIPKQAFDPSKKFEVVDFKPLGEPVDTSAEALSYFSNRLQELSIRMFLLEPGADPHWANLNPTREGFERVETSICPLLVSTKSFEPYLDGFRITLEVGNMQSATIANVGLTARWGTNSVPQEVTPEQTYTFAAGYWTPIDFTISPATLADTKSVRVSFQPRSLHLKTYPKAK